MTLGERCYRDRRNEEERKENATVCLTYVVARVFANYLERQLDSNWTLR